MEDMTKFKWSIVVVLLTLAYIYCNMKNDKHYLYN